MTLAPTRAPSHAAPASRPEGADRYAEWIEAYVARQPNRFVRGKCYAAATEMCAAFPELRHARGFVFCTWGEDQHHWCVAPDGTIVDPTASQFVSVFSYEEIDPDNPHRPVPTGRCADCGEPVYDHASFCDDTCALATEAYLNSVVS